jgi:two-component system, sensor histidine kinase LadS
MQGFAALPAKMHSMFSLQAIFSTQSALALRWLAAVWIGLALMSSALAQVTSHKVDLQEETQRAGVQVKQTLWIDESRQLDFESARTQEFKPFNPFERLSLGNKVAWLRLEIEQTDATTGPLLLHLLPPHIGEVTLYSPSSNTPEVWTKRQVDNKELASKIKVGEASKGDIFYLRISSRNNASILAFLGGKEEMNVHDRKLAVVMTFISTLTLITFIIFLWRTLRQFSWMSVLICALLVSYQIQFWIGMGFAYTLLNLPLAAGIIMVTPNIIANFAIAGGILVLIGCTFFPNQKWLRWLWIWSALQFCMFVYAFIEPSVASKFSMTVWLIGPIVLAVFLIVAAIREPASLRFFSSKLAFVLLLVTCLLLEAVAWKSGGILGSHSIQLTTDLLIKNIFVRFPQLIVIIVLATWIFERIRANHLNMLSGELQKSKESLEMESKRLDRQRKFTAMLAHELKNPLAVSHMALSGIESRLGNSDPMMERAAAIKQSLQDINAIIDRCSEIDGFEQGDLPMSIHSFNLDHFLALLKEANSSERIYFVKRGVHDNATINSDIQYLKIILNNLLTNALKYSPPDTLIEMSVQSVLDAKGIKSLNFCVSNEVGEAGTPAPDRAFERFYRAEAARNQSGAGLGLWLSQELAHALDTEVVMQQDDHKISFSLVLPYA